MNILFICDDFFGYAREIKRAIEERGHRVFWFLDRHATDPFSKAAIRLAPRLVQSKAEKYLDSILSQVANERIDRVLLIKGEGISLAMIRRLRSALSGAEFTLYFWDSYKNMPSDSPSKVDLFDRAFTFDPGDAAADPRLSYRPLFYLDDYSKLQSTGEDIDVLFFGTVHSDRYAVLTRLQAAMPDNISITKVLYFPSHWIYFLRRIFDSSMWRSSSKEFIFSPLPRAEVMSLLSRAKVVIDIERPVQSGLTMRTLEMFGASKKLITTNVEAARAEFFHGANIHVIDRKAPVIDRNFLASPFQPMSHSITRRYSLSGWLDEIVPAVLFSRTSTSKANSSLPDLNPRESGLWRENPGRSSP